MKATITANGKSVEVELTNEQAKTLGIEEEKKTGWERVRENFPYCCINGLMSVSDRIEYTTLQTNEFYNKGNYFSDSNLAEKMAKRISLMLRMQRWADEHNDKIDWSNEKQHKYFIYCEEASHCFKVSYYSTLHSLENIWFSSQELAEKAIKIFGDELKEAYIE